MPFTTPVTPLRAECVGISGPCEAGKLGVSSQGKPRGRSRGLGCTRRKGLLLPHCSEEPES